MKLVAVSYLCILNCIMLLLYRGKTKTIDKTKVISLDDLPVWNFDGSSTNQSTGEDSDVYIKPCRIFK